MSSVDPRRVITAALSVVGRVRSHNEDYCSEFVQPSGSRLLVVADGMGGHRGGATASRVAVESLGEAFRSSSQAPAAALRSAFQAANDGVYRMALDNAELRGMGTTLVALLLTPNDGEWVAHVGDSRAYRLRAGTLEALTADHSVVAEMQRQGLITEEEAAVHPRRNEIMRSVGVEANVEPDVARIELEPGDSVLLCSDGLSGLVKDSEIADIAAREAPARAAQMLVDTANDRGGIDNITVQIAAVPERPEVSEVEPGPPVSGANAGARRSWRGLAIAVLWIGAMAGLVRFCA